GKLVAHLTAERSGLGELQVMGIRWSLLADEAWLPPDESEMHLAAFAQRVFGEGKSGVRAALPGEVSTGGTRVQVGRERRCCAVLRWRRRRLWLCHVDCGKDGFPEPRMVGGLDRPDVRLYEGVFEGEADLRPGQQLRAVPQCCELGKEPFT